MTPMLVASVNCSVDCPTLERFFGHPTPEVDHGLQDLMEAITAAVGETVFQRGEEDREECEKIEFLREWEITEE